MIVEESLKDGKLIRHKSDQGLMIRQVETGAEYSEAVDVAPCKYTYEETDKPVPTAPTRAEAAADSDLEEVSDSEGEAAE